MTPSTEQEPLDLLSCWEVARARALAYSPDEHRATDLRPTALRTWDREVLERLRSRPRAPHRDMLRSATPAPTPRAGHRRATRSTTPGARRRAGSDSEGDPPPARRERLRRRAAVVAFRGCVDRLALTAARFHEQTAGLTSHERLIVFGWLPQWARDQFHEDVQRRANLDPARGVWQA